MTDLLRLQTDDRETLIQSVLDGADLAPQPAGLRPRPAPFPGLAHRAGAVAADQGGGQRLQEPPHRQR